MTVPFGHGPRAEGWVGWLPFGFAVGMVLWAAVLVLLNTLR